MGIGSAARTSGNLRHRHMRIRHPLQPLPPGPACGCRQGQVMDRSPGHRTVDPAIQRPPAGRSLPGWRTNLSLIHKAQAGKTLNSYAYSLTLPAIISTTIN